MAGWFIRHFYSRICDEIAVFLNNFIFVLIHFRVFMKDQPYGVVIFSGLRGRVDAVRQPCPAKRLTPMGLLAGENARGFYVILGGISVIFRCEFIWVYGKNTCKQALRLGLLVEQG